MRVVADEQALEAVKVAQKSKTNMQTQIESALQHSQLRSERALRVARLKARPPLDTMYLKSAIVSSGGPAYTKLATTCFKRSIDIYGAFEDLLLDMFPLTLYLMEDLPALPHLSLLASQPDRFRSFGSSGISEKTT